MKADKLKDILVSLDENPVQVFFSSIVQSVDVLEWVLQQVGAADVWQTSFSISEEFLRRLYLISKKGRIHSYTLILDFKATNKIVKLWPMLDRAIQHTYLTENHSKVLLVKAKSGMKISVITSQNFTRGNRLEATVIASGNEIFDSLYNQINSIIKDKSIRFDDFYRKSNQTG